MKNIHRTRLLAITFVTAFIFMALQPGIVNASTAFPDPPNGNVGPNIDKIVWQVIEEEANLVLALQTGEVDMHEHFIEVASAQALATNPDIEIIDDVLRHGFGHIKMDTSRSPYNWTAFRRAFALAYDKERVQTEIFEGLSELHDSHIPITNTLYCIEDSLDYHYYTDQSTEGNALLDAAGFTRDFTTYPTEGWRVDPNGNPINVVIAYSPDVPYVGGGCAQIGVDALEALHIQATTDQEDFNTYISALNSHEPYEMLFFGVTFSGLDIDWLEREFASYYADVNFQNDCNFRNATIDAVLQRIVNAQNYTEAYDAGAEAQRLLHYEQPYVVVYENVFLQAYRTDQFKGVLMDQGGYAAGYWSLMNLIKNDDTFGGTVKVQLDQEPSTFNLFTYTSGYSAAVLDMIVSGLYGAAPDLSYYPVLAESYIEETHEDNDAVPLGHHRFTFDIIQNATWSDGVQLTAEDVAFTYTYLYETSLLGNPRGVTFGNLVSAYAPSTYRVVVEFAIENVWNFGIAAGPTILPKHIFGPDGDIGYEGWETWNPMFNPAHPFVTCGPFVFTDMEAGEFYELTHNPYWAYYPQERLATTTTGPTGPTGPTTPEPFDPTLAIVAGAVGAAVVILVGGFVLLRQK